MQLACGQIQGVAVGPSQLTRYRRAELRDTLVHGCVHPVGFQNCASGLDLGFYAARSYSLIRPPSTGRRFICFWERSAAR
jgi:hypothetical protein